MVLEQTPNWKIEWLENEKTISCKWIGTISPQKFRKASTNLLDYIKKYPVHNYLSDTTELGLTPLSSLSGDFVEFCKSFEVNGVSDFILVSKHTHIEEEWVQRNFTCTSSPLSKWVQRHLQHNDIQLNFYSYENIEHALSNYKSSSTGTSA